MEKSLLTAPYNLRSSKRDNSTNNQPGKYVMKRSLQDKPDTPSDSDESSTSDSEILSPEDDDTEYETESSCSTSSSDLSLLYVSDSEDSQNVYTNRKKIAKHNEQALFAPAPNRKRRRIVFSDSDSEEKIEYYDDDKLECAPELNSTTLYSNEGSTDKTTSSEDPMSVDDSEDEDEVLTDEEVLTDDEDICYGKGNQTMKSLSELKKANPKAFEMLQIVRKEIELTEPKLEDYLQENLLMKDRIRLVQLYDIYQNTYLTSVSEDFLELRKRLNTLFTEAKNNYKQYMKYTPEEHAQMEKESSSIETVDTQMNLKYKIMTLNTSSANKQVIYQKFHELYKQRLYEDEFGKLKNWISTAISLPHDNIKTIQYDNIRTFMKRVADRLDEEFYGMKSVKEQILLFLNSKLLYPNMKKCVLGLIGAAGTGKTSITRTLADIMDIPFSQISFGGVSNPEFLKGHDYTYIGSQPGEIVRCLKRMKYKNGILFLDEFEKVSENKNMCATLLHIMDPSQNTEFRDNYLAEITIDLSNIWFVLSMNDLPTDPALRDRIYTIHVPSYTLEEKRHILNKHLIRRALKNIGLNETDIVFDEEASVTFIQKVCSESDKGVRAIEQALTDLVNKINFIVHHHSDPTASDKLAFSFDTPSPLTYPVTITSKLVNHLVLKRYDNNNSEPPMHMYM